MRNKKIVNVMLNYGIVMILVVLLVIFSIASRNFLKASTIFTILKQVSTVGIVSVGMTFVMLTGGIDLSVGSIIGVAAVGAATFMQIGLHPVLACLFALLLGTLFGGANGFFVNFFSIPALIGTLGTMTSLRGVAYLITDGLPVFGFSDSFSTFAQGSLGIIPYPVIVMVFVFIVAGYVLSRTKTGRYLYGVGGNEEASRLSGINVKKIKYIAYSVSGLLAALAGIILLSRTNSGQPAAGSGYEMDAITAVVLGGVSISGGEGQLGLVVVGVIIMGVLTTGMIMCNINDYIQQVIKGLVLVFAVAFAKFSQAMRAKNIVTE